MGSPARPQRRPSGCSATEAGQTQGAAGHGMMCAVPYLGGGVGVDQGQFDDAGPTSGHREGPAARRPADFLGGAHERERVRQHVTRSREQVGTGRAQCGAQRRNRPGHPARGLRQLAGASWDTLCHACRASRAGTVSGPRRSHSRSAWRVRRCRSRQPPEPRPKPHCGVRRVALPRLGEILGG